VPVLLFCTWRWNQALACFVLWSLYAFPRPWPRSGGAFFGAPTVGGTNQRTHNARSLKSGECPLPRARATIEQPEPDREWTPPEWSPDLTRPARPAVRPAVAAGTLWSRGKRREAGDASRTHARCPEPDTCLRRLRRHRMEPRHVAGAARSWMGLGTADHRLRCLRALLASWASRILWASRPLARLQPPPQGAAGAAPARLGGSPTRPRDGRVSRTTARTFATASASAGAIAEAKFPHSSTPCQQFSPARALMVLSSAGARGRGLDLGAAAIERVPSGGADSCIRAGCYPDPNSARRKPAMCLAHRLR